MAKKNYLSKLSVRSSQLCFHVTGGNIKFTLNAVLATNQIAGLISVNYFSIIFRINRGQSNR